MRDRDHRRTSTSHPIGSVSRPAPSDGFDLECFRHRVVVGSSRRNRDHAHSYQGSDSNAHYDRESTANHCSLDGTAESGASRSDGDSHRHLIDGSMRFELPIQSSQRPTGSVFEIRGSRRTSRWPSFYDLPGSGDRRGRSTVRLGDVDLHPTERLCAGHRRPSVGWTIALSELDSHLDSFADEDSLRDVFTHAERHDDGHPSPVRLTDGAAVEDAYGHFHRYADGGFYRYPNPNPNEVAHRHELCRRLQRRQSGYRR